LIAGAEAATLSNSRLERPREREEDIMAQRCDICGKGSQFGNRVSHAHNVTHRRFRPNLQSVRAVVAGTHTRVRVCTRCLRSGKVVKPAPQPKSATA
jgi:large subunit ribosomal protein L28